MMLNQVSDSLQRAKLTSNKSKFWYSRANYLMYVVGGRCIRTDDAKIGFAPAPRMIRRPLQSREEQFELNA